MAFAEILGHRSLLFLISRAVARESVPPSLMFVGPGGVGKQKAALALAQILNCSSLVRPSVRNAGQSEVLPVDACGRCSVCKRIARRAFADVFLIEPSDSGSIPIDRVRDAIGQVAYRPFEGRRRVVIINDADRLVPEAQNALLKTLEEPPESSQFALVTSRPDMLLATVRSRCQKLSFGQLSGADVVEILQRSHGYDKTVAQVAAASSGGSVGRALQLASGELAAGRESAIALLEAVASARDAKTRLEGAKGFLTAKGIGRAPVLARQELSRRLRALISLLRDTELVAAGGDKRSLANSDLLPGISILATTFGGSRGLAAFTVVGRALEAAESNVNPKTVADWLACEL